MARRPVHRMPQREGLPQGQWPFLAGIRGSNHPSRACIPVIGLGRFAEGYESAAGWPEAKGGASSSIGVWEQACLRTMFSADVVPQTFGEIVSTQMDQAI